MKFLSATVFTATSLIGGVYSDCPPFADNVPGLNPGSATFECKNSAGDSIGTDVTVPIGSTCDFKCEAPGLPRGGDAEVSGAYECEESTLGTQCVDSWVAANNVGYSCSPVTCDPFADFAEDLGIAEYNCTDMDGVATCTVTACDTNWVRSAVTEELTYTCVSETSSAGTWTQGSDAKAACVEITCDGTVAPTVDGAEFFCFLSEEEVEEDGVGVLPIDGPNNNLWAVGVECAPRCTQAVPEDPAAASAMGISNLNRWTCTAPEDVAATTGIWTPPEVLPTCVAVTCPQAFSEFVNGVTGTESADDCSNGDDTTTGQAAGTTCNIACTGPTHELDVPAMTEVTCTRGSNTGDDFATNEGTWEGDECVASANCGQWQAFASGNAALMSGVASVSCTDRNGGNLDVGAAGMSGATCTLTCETDFSLADADESQYTCDPADPVDPAQGTWTGTARCLAHCPSPNTIVADNGIDAGNFANGEIACVESVESTESHALADTAPVGVVCTAACDTGYGYANASIKSWTCQEGGMWSTGVDGAAPTCEQVSCPSFEEVLRGEDGAPNATGICNGENDVCTFDDDIELSSTEARALGQVCALEACGTGFVFSKESPDVVYKCERDETQSAIGIWQLYSSSEEGGDICLQACSGALILETAYDEDCCADIGGCDADFGGCTDDSHCNGDLLCGNPGDSCSFNLEGNDTSRCCVEPASESPEPSATTPGSEEEGDSAASLEARVATMFATVVAVTSLVFA